MPDHARRKNQKPALSTRRDFLSLPLAALPLAAAAQAYPNKPIRLVVPFPPGGPVDLTGRIVAKIVGDALGQSVVVDNRSGAGGVVGTDAIAKAAPDGYTIGMGSIASLGINPGLMEKLPFRVPQDFSPIADVAASSGVILAAASAPFNDLKGMIAYARANPGKLTYASAGIGSVGHMVGESLNHAAGIQMVHVPYRGTAPAAQDLLAGSVMSFIETSLATAITYLPTGRIKAIAVTRKSRAAQLPDVPSLGEAGFPQIDSPAWFGVVGPAGMPKDVVDKLSVTIRDGLKDAQVAEQLSHFGAEPTPRSPTEFGAYIEREVERWKQVIKLANIKPV